MSRREEIITEILERWAEFYEPGVKTGVIGDGDGVPHMPDTYTASVREVERLMVRMREERRSQWWHVSERYFRCHRSVKDIPVKRKTVGGKSFVETERRLVDIWSPSVRLEKVRRGIGWIADEWSLVTEPMLPPMLVKAA